MHDINALSMLTFQWNSAALGLTETTVDNKLGCEIDTLS